ncbi:MAG: hypothetical protein IJ574_00010 [Bacilli bacterium]|nr:hypothetical protein [Bacilli bacterium]
MFEKDEDYDESLTIEEWNKMYDANEEVTEIKNKPKKKKNKKVGLTPLEEYYLQKAINELGDVNEKINELKEDIEASEEAIEMYKNDYLRVIEFEEDIRYDKTKLMKYYDIRNKLESIINKINKVKEEIEQSNETGKIR